MKRSNTMDKAFIDRMYQKVQLRHLLSQRPALRRMINWISGGAVESQFRLHDKMDKVDLIIAYIDTDQGELPEGYLRVSELGRKVRIGKDSYGKNVYIKIDAIKDWMRFILARAIREDRHIKKIGISFMGKKMYSEYDVYREQGDPKYPIEPKTRVLPPEPYID